jgi:hypothetical protein
MLALLILSTRRRRWYVSGDSSPWRWTLRNSARGALHHSVGAEAACQRRYTQCPVLSSRADGPCTVFSLPVNQIRLSIVSEKREGKVLQDEYQVASYGTGLTLLLKNLGPQIGWRTVRPTTALLLQFTVSSFLQGFRS